MALRAPLPASKLKARRRKRRLLVVLVALIALLLVVAGIIGASWLPALRIRDIDVRGVSSASTEAVTSMAREEVTGTYGFVLPKNNALLYPRDAIEARLLKQFSSFESVTVRLANIHTMSITVVERKTTALWCGESVKNPSPCYLLDASGKAFAPAADYSGDVFIKYYGPASGSAMRQYLSPDQFANTAALALAFAGSGVNQPPVHVAVEQGEVRVAFANGFEVIYMLKDDAADILDRLTIALESEPFTKHALENVAYLDLRFGDKLYYHLK